MTSSANFDDAYVERLLRRRGLSADGHQDPAGSFVAAVADLGRSAPAPTGALAVLLAEGFDPATLESPAAASPDRHASRWRTRRWAGLSLAAKLSAVAGVALGGLATAASAGVLPDQLQDRIGGLLEVTTPFEFPSAPTPAPATTPTTPTTPTKRPPPTPPPADGRPGTGPASGVPVAPEDIPGTPGPGPATVDLPRPTPAPAAAPTESADPQDGARPVTPPAPPQRPGRGAAPEDVPTPPAGPRQQAPGASRPPVAPGPGQPPFAPGPGSFGSRDSSGSRGQDPGPATSGRSTTGRTARSPLG
ncbi:MAG: hypothetical protein ACR2K2_11595 [Mycobacteriales bacterium]